MKKLRPLLFIFTLAIFGLASNISMTENAEAFRGGQICEEFDEHWEDHDLEPCFGLPMNCMCEVVVKE